MNNRFFVPVLALGIAALGAFASPAQAATADLQFQIGGTTNGTTYSWLDSLTMTGSDSLWQWEYYYTAQDNSNNYVIESKSPESGAGAGTFTQSVSIGPLPAAGHSIQVWVLNTGSWVGAPNGWGAPTQVKSYSTNSDGSFTVG